MKNKMDLSKRIESLEAISAIKDLKFKYWKACDTKKPITVLKCFHPDKVEIDFEDFGIFHSAQDMVDKYRMNSCHDHLIENHSGKNPIINIHDTYSASGMWSMAYSLVDTKKNIILNISGRYQDLYVKIKNQWLIKETKFTKSTTFYRSINNQFFLKIKANRSFGFKETV